MRSRLHTAFLAAILTLAATAPLPAAEIDAFAKVQTAVQEPKRQQESQENTAIQTKSRRRARQEQREALQTAKEAQEALKEKSKAGKSEWMGYRVEDGDTVYYSSVPPVWVFPKGSKMKGKDYSSYYKLVYNFNKVYPYALMAGRIQARADSTMAAGHMNKKQQEEYLAGLQKELLHTFGPIIKSLTISQGKLVIRLIDREAGRTSYKIIKDYRSAFSAVFWQGIAKLFGQNLKNRYDPDGEDRVTEELVRKWENGEFRDLYYSIFFTYPKETVIPSKYR